MNSSSFLQIKKILKQRYPMLLVDKVLDTDSVMTTTVKYFTNSDPFMRGHFKDFPIYPAVLLIELMAQSVSFSLYDRYGKIDNIWFLSIQRCHYHGYFVPGDIAETKVEIVGVDANGLINCKGKIVNQNHKKIVECNFVLIRKDLE
ncbi:3-hydroxyacyl-ACP dehydratase FabZ family protein [Lactobacillus crispatus]|uniref:3-hydroxyacyl-ACP dehydratase FabZ family protein n=1 Tax=Lactobacillus crispatus TaxID=47770 RepID=UPI0022E66F9E|nr:3-hydroxyacyl-ACP dehydratase FabZ family protein [Lactobacillus crispatus]